jgi:hypothetical protein
MKKATLLLLLSLSILDAASVEPADYCSRDGGLVSYIYPAGSDLNISSISRFHQNVLRSYEKEYGYKPDSRLFVTLASQKDQIANAFSTQFPLNEQVLYGGGVGKYDYFSITSWLKNLLIHESAHSFQLAPAENTLSKIARKISGHSVAVNPLFVPMMPYPNVTESGYILEGNAVLNESLYGNGGRLYSGYALAETVVQARAGNVTPQKMYNIRYRFPGGEKFYLIGGEFQKFLAQRYGLKRVNSYFKSYSKQPFPFFGNSVFKRHYGKDFVMLTREFGSDILSHHQGFRPSGGKLLAKSQISIPLERSGDEIYTLIGDKKSAPKVLKLDMRSNKTIISGGWRVGKIFKEGEHYYTQSSARTSPTQVSMGLFDQDGYIKKGSASKVWQGRMKNGKEVYLSVPASWDQPHLFVGDRFYGVVNSSVFVRGNNLYYFKQSGSKRYLYKNHKRLTSFKGYYGKVCDVDSKGRIYFVATSRHGTTAYRYDHGTTWRITSGDDVMSIKLSSVNQAIVQTVTATGYEIKRVRLQPKRARVASYDLHIPQHDTGAMERRQDARLGDESKYGELSQMRFSSLQSQSTYNSTDGYGLELKAIWTDPLWQNTLSFALRYQKQRSLISASYSNSAHMIHWGGKITAVKKATGYDNTKYRSIGYSAYATLPFLATGYWRGAMGVTYSKPHDDTQREPLGISANLSFRQQFGYSKYPNHYFGIDGFVSKDRDAVYAGVSAAWMHDMPGQTYVKIDGAYMYSSKTDKSRHIGIKAGKSSSSSSDRAAMNIPSLDKSYYLKSASRIGLGLYKVFDYEWLNYHFPISLLRESVYLKHNIYRLKFQNGASKTMHESIAGIEGDVLMFHKGVVPIKLEVLYNQAAKKHVQMRVGAEYRF